MSLDSEHLKLTYDEVLITTLIDLDTEGKLAVAVRCHSI